MVNTNTIRIKRKMLGVLIRNARQRAGFNLEEMAKLLGIPANVLADYELGRREAGLPLLEGLAKICNVPVSHFWADNPLPNKKNLHPVAKSIPIRRKMIGAMLSKARTEAGHSHEKVAKFLGISVETIKNYEYGKVDIPFSYLSALTTFLKVPLSNFLEEGDVAVQSSNGHSTKPSTPVPSGVQPASTAVTPLSESQLKQVGSLPKDMVEFLKDPTNLLYLRLAMRLEKVSADTLRNLAEGILDITY